MKISTHDTQPAKKNKDLSKNDCLQIIQKHNKTNTDKMEKGAYALIIDDSCHSPISIQLSIIIAIIHLLVIDFASTSAKQKPIMPHSKQKTERT